MMYLPTFITSQAQYVASENPEWIVWQTPDGTDCGPPYPPYNYTRPEGYDPSCNWNPVNTKILGSIDFSSISYYSSVVNSCLSVLGLLLLTPLADFSYYKKWMVFILG